MKPFRLGAVLIMVVMSLTAENAQESRKFPFQNPGLPLEERVKDLVSRMTLEEKISQMSHLAPAIEHLGVIAYEPNFSNPLRKEIPRSEIGKKERYKKLGHSEIHNHWPGGCLAGGWWNEALHGVARAGLATAFPQAIGLGSTWNPGLIQRMASAIGDEARVHNLVYGKKLTYWSPTINILRDPRWGRTEESYSEDPYLLSRMTVAFVKGFQGEHPYYLKAVATIKHFVANNSEFNRHDGSSDVSERQLHEYYLPAFKAGIVEGGAFSVMAAYNALNGRPCSVNPWLLTDLLRNQWGFQGYVVSDCGAIADIVHSHMYETDPEKAVALAVRAGLDLECENCGVDQYLFDRHLLNAVQKGYVSEETIDLAVIRLFRARFRLGEFDPPERVPYTAILESVLDSPEHRQLALEAARESMVLLKNEKGTLPLDAATLGSLAIIGPNADVAELGGYSGTPAFKVTPLEGIRQKLGVHRIYHAPGCTVTEPIPGGLSQAVKVASRCDTAVVVLGTNLEMVDESLDRSHLGLPDVQVTLLREVYKANPNTILVLMNGVPLSVNWAQENIPAILEAWYPGQSGGTAIADVLFGDYNPGGRLPVTFYKSSDQLPPLDDYDITKGRTYLYFKGEPLYAFGHGLSYTSFEYVGLSIDKKTYHHDDSIEVKVDVKNTGWRDGDEVIQLYMRNIDSPVVQPIRQLKAFQRVRIRAGETKAVKFVISAERLAYWDEIKRRWEVEPGEYVMEAGSSSDDVRLHKSFVISRQFPI